MTSQNTQRGARIKRTSTALHHVARCETCKDSSGAGIILAPDGADREGRDPDLAARAHLFANPDHDVSMSYTVEVHYLLVQHDAGRSVPFTRGGAGPRR